MIIVQYFLKKIDFPFHKVSFELTIDLSGLFFNFLNVLDELFHLLKLLICILRIFTRYFILTLLFLISLFITLLLFITLVLLSTLVFLCTLVLLSTMDVSPLGGMDLCVWNLKFLIGGLLFSFDILIALFYIWRFLLILIFILSLIRVFQMLLVKTISWILMWVIALILISRGLFLGYIILTICVII